MMKTVAVIVSCLLVAGMSVLAVPDNADQKWLDVVQQMVEKGQTKISTPNQDRVELLKKWAARKGYSVDVVKSDAGYRLNVSKTVAKN